jgi:hypothetical protein
MGVKGGLYGSYYVSHVLNHKEWETRMVQHQLPHQLVPIPEPKKYSLSNIFTDIVWSIKNDHQRNFVDIATRAKLENVFQQERDAQESDVQESDFEESTFKESDFQEGVFLSMRRKKALLKRIVKKSINILLE